ncbi:hypothetical protein QTP88_003778 [Uroleucon formosanum]
MDTSFFGGHRKRQVKIYIFIYDYYLINVRSCKRCIRPYEIFIKPNYDDNSIFSRFTRVADLTYYLGLRRNFTTVLSCDLPENKARKKVETRV